MSNLTHFHALKLFEDITMHMRRCYDIVTCIVMHVGKLFYALKLFEGIEHGVEHQYIILIQTHISKLQAAVIDTDSTVSWYYETICYA